MQIIRFTTHEAAGLEEEEEILEPIQIKCRHIISVQTLGEERILLLGLPLES